MIDATQIQSAIVRVDLWLVDATAALRRILPLAVISVVLIVLFLRGRSKK